MKRVSTYNLRNSYSSIKLIGFVFLISFFLLKPVIQSITNVSNDNLELCENNEENNTEEIELSDDFIDEFHEVKKLSFINQKKGLCKNSLIFYPEIHLSNFIIEVLSPPPEII